MRVYVVLTFALLAGCAGGDAYPDLVPTDRILAEPPLPAHAAPAAAGAAPVAAATTGRADALRARADALRGPVVDPALRRRAGG
nr:hypothetical protein [Paracoccus saliphilus]